MLDLSPVKLLVILIVVMLLLGPDKLPQAARQMGAAWRKLRDLQQRIDSEVRQNIPDLPSTGDIARYARSPLTFLNQLADNHGDDAAKPAPATGETAGEPGDADTPSPSPSAPSPPPVSRGPVVAPFDPSLN